MDTMIEPDLIEPVITLEPVLRDCPHNKELKEGEKAIRDLRVHIDGEFRALLVRAHSGTRGWHLHDADGRAIHMTDDWGSRYVGLHVDFQRDIMPTIAEALRKDRIPTLERMEELRAAEQAAKDKEARDANDRILAYRIERNGSIALLEAAEAFLARQTFDTDETLRALIKKIRKEAKEAGYIAPKGE